MRKYLIYVGLKHPKKNDVPETNSPPYLDAQKLEIATLYKNYLSDINEGLERRRMSIETKTSQIIGQSGIIISIFGLFFSFIVNDLITQPVFWQVLITAFCLICLFHYITAICHATRNLMINNFRYQTQSSSTITNSQRQDTQIGFLNMEIKDLLEIIRTSEETDNIKGDHLVCASRCFQIANITFGIIVIAMILLTVINPVYIEQVLQSSYQPR
jgi:hypothetical protein